MNKHEFTSITLVLLLFSLLGISVANAYTIAPPESYVVANGKYILVLHTTGSYNQNHWESKYNATFYEKYCSNKVVDPSDKLIGWTSQEINDKCSTIDALKLYQYSGLYVRNNPSHLLWSFDWYDGEVILAADGEHLIRINPSVTKLDSEAISFYRNGKMTALYKVSDLVDVKLERGEITSLYYWRKSSSYDESSNSYKITTVGGNEFTFNINSGRIEKLTYSSASGDSSKVVGIRRPIEIRMHWNAENWSQIRDNFCDKAKFITNPNIDNINILLNQYASINCKVSSKAYEKMLVEVGSWMLAQTNSKEKENLAKRIALLQENANLWDSLIPIYEYQLETTINTDNKLMSILKSVDISDQLELITKLVEASIEIGNERKQKEFEKKYYTMVTEHILRSTAKLDENNAYHEYLLTNYKRYVQKACVLDTDKNNEIRHIISSVIGMEKKIHPKGHEHVLQGLQDLIECHLQGDKQTLSEIKTAIRYYEALEKDNLLENSSVFKYGHNLKNMTYHYRQKILSKLAATGKKTNDGVNSAENQIGVEVYRLNTSIENILITRYIKIGDGASQFAAYNWLVKEALKLDGELSQAKYYYHKADELLATIENRGLTNDVAIKQAALESLEIHIMDKTRIIGKGSMDWKQEMFAKYNEKKGDTARAFWWCNMIVSPTLKSEEDYQVAKVYLKKANELLVKIKKNESDKMYHWAAQQMGKMEQNITKYTIKLQKEQTEKYRVLCIKNKKQGNRNQVFNWCTELVSAALKTEKDFSKTKYYFDQAKDLLDEIEKKDSDAIYKSAREKLESLEEKVLRVNAKTGYDFMEVDKALCDKYRNRGDRNKAFRSCTDLAFSAYKLNDIPKSKIYINQAKEILSEIEKYENDQIFKRSRSEIENLEYRIMQIDAKTEEDVTAIHETLLARFKNRGESTAAYYECIELLSAAVQSDEGLSQAKNYYKQAKDLLAEMKKTESERNYMSAVKTMQFYDELMQRKTAQKE